MKVWLLVAIVSIALSACGGVKPVSLGVPELLRDVAYMDGKDVAVCGWFDVGQDRCLLSASRYLNDSGYLHASEVWILPRFDICAPFVAYANPRAGWAVVSGMFKTGGGWGHLGMYEHLIAADTIRFVERCPAVASTILNERR